MFLKKNNLILKDKETLKYKWLEKCVEELKDNKWVIISIKHIKEILQQYQEVFSVYKSNFFFFFSLKIFQLETTKHLFEPNVWFQWSQFGSIQL